MRKTNLFALASALALLVSPMLALASPDSVQACWKPAFLAGDADAVAKCYAADAVLWLPGAPIMQGRDAIRAGYVDFFAGMSVKSVTLSEMGNSSRGDEASSWGTYSMVYVSKADGKEVTDNGRYTDFSRKIDGNWQYVVDHASADPVAAPTPAAAAN